MLKLVSTFTVALLLSTSFVNAKNISVGNKPVVVVDGVNVQHRICMYAGKQYSVGAMLEVGGYVIICQNANEFESNGAVQWHQVKPHHVKQK